MSIDCSFARQGQSRTRLLGDPPRGKDVSAKADRTAGPRAQRLPSREELMKQARLDAEQGDEFILQLEKEGVFFFYNSPRPFCYTYMIPGVWVLSPAESAWRSKDGREIAGV